MEKFLSIVIPVYNVQEYIEKCLDSVFNLAIEENLFEVIVVNDGTKDNSMAMVRKYASHINLVVIDKINGGLSSARNAGMEVANGEYIWFIDSDDYINPEHSMIVLDKIKNSDSEIIYTDVAVIDETGRMLGVRGLSGSKDITLSGAKWLGYRPQICPMAQAYIYKTLFLKQHYLYFKEGILHEDIEFQFRALLAAAKVTYICNPPIYMYLKREGSITSRITSKRLKDLLNTVEAQADIALNVDSSLSNDLSRCIWNNYKYLLYFIYHDHSLYQHINSISRSNRRICKALHLMAEDNVFERVKMLMAFLNPRCFLLITKLTHLKEKKL